MKTEAERGLLGVQPTPGLAAVGGLTRQTESSAWGEFRATFSFAKYLSIVNAQKVESRRKSFSLDVIFLLPSRITDYGIWELGGESIL